MTWFIPTEKMSVKQREVIDKVLRSPNKTHWIQGFAGTGKTVVLTNLMKRISVDYPSHSMCFITYTHALTDLVASGLNDKFTISTHTQFIKQKIKYDHVFLDEVQDISPNHLVKIQNLSGKLVIAGDPDQTIYADSALASEIEAMTKPEKSVLTEIFRLTKLLYGVAMSILPGAKLVEGNEAIQQTQPQIKLLQCEDYETECYEMYKQARRLAKPSNPSVMLFPYHEELLKFSRTLALKLTNDIPPDVNPKIKPYWDDPKYPTYEDLNLFWEEHDRPISFLGSGWGSFAASELKPIVYLMTMHSSKGLDFRSVFIPGLNSHTRLIPEKKALEDPDLERRLLFVAVTRSRRDLFLSYTSKKPHPFILDFPKTITKKYISSQVEDEDEDIL